MKYKQLVLQKLEMLENYLMGIDSMISGQVTRLEMKDRIERTKQLVVEIESLIQKEG